MNNKVFGAGCSKEDEAGSELVRKLNNNEPPLYTYCMHFAYGQQSLHEVAYDMMSHAASSMLKPQDVHTFHIFWLGFVHHWFGLPVTDTSKCFPPTEDSDSAAAPALVDEFAEDSAVSMLLGFDQVSHIVRSC